jgi:parallel beta-helix repeat protein
MLNATSGTSAQSINLSGILKNMKWWQATIMIVSILLAGGYAASQGANVSVNIDLQARIQTIENKLDIPVNSSLSAFLKSNTYMVSLVDAYACLMNGSNAHLIEFLTNHTQVIDDGLNNASVFGGSVYVASGAYTAPGVTVPNNTRLVIDDGATGITYTVATGATCIIDDFNGFNVQYYAGGISASHVDLYSYLVGVSASGSTYFMKNGTDGLIDYNSTNPNSVIYAAEGNLTPGRTYKQEIVLAPGNYTFSTVQNVSSYTYIEEQGAHITLASNANSSIWQNDNWTAGDTSIEIHHGSLDGNKANQYPTLFFYGADRVEDGIHFHQVSNSVIEGVNITNTLMHGIWLSGGEYPGTNISPSSDNNLIENCYISNAGVSGMPYFTVSGIVLFSNVTNTRVIDNIIIAPTSNAATSSRGFYLSGNSSGNLFSGNIVVGYNTGANMEGFMENGPCDTSNTIIDNIFRNDWIGIKLIETDGLGELHNVVSDNQIINARDGIVVTGPKSTEITENTISSNNTGIFFLNNDTDISISNCAIASLYGIYGYTTNMTRVTITPGNIINGTYRAIDFSDATCNLVNCTIRLNTINNGALAFGSNHPLMSQNLGYVTEASGTATFSGDGHTTQFLFPDYLAGPATDYFVTSNTNAAGSNYYITSNSSGLTINYIAPLSNGTSAQIAPWVSGFDTAPTNVGNAVDGDPATVTGIGNKNQTSTYQDCGDYGWDLGSVQTVAIQLKIGMWSNASSVGGYWYYSSNNISWTILEAGANAGGASSTSEVIVYTPVKVLQARYIRYTVENTGTNEAVYSRLYEAYTIGQLPPPVGTNNLQFSWKAEYQP